MYHRKILILLTILLVLVITFALVPDAFAKLKATAPFYVWDDNDLHFSHDIVSIWLDGHETDVIHELGFNNDPYNPEDGATTQAMCEKVAALENPAHPQHDRWLENCPDARDTKYAGVMELGVPLDKTEPEGLAFVFDYTLEWSLIDCDLNGDMSWDHGDLTFNTLLNHPALLPNWDIMTFPTPTVPFPAGLDQRDYFKVLAIDVVTPCSMGNCDHELVTTIFLDLDINKDNLLTAAGDGVPADATGALPGGCVCFFAKAFPIDKSVTPTAIWGGNPQARITAGGGDKTVNFNLFGPSAITLENLVARSPGGIHPYVWLVIVTLLASVAFMLIRESRIQRREIFVRKNE